MSEDTFARFRRLRGVAQPVSVQEQAQQIEGEAPFSPLALFQQLHALGIVLTPYPDGTVRCRASKGTLTPALVDAMRQHKAALHELVEEWSERAAIAEYCGGLSREQAEALAWQYALVEEVVTHG
jgi:hypothetical protein